MSPAVGSVSVSLRHEDGAVHESRWAAGAPDLGVTRTVPWQTFRWRVGVGTRFAYDGELVTVVEMFASAHGNEILVRDGRDRRFRLSLREALASGRARVIPDGPGPSSDEPRETASVILGQLTAEALKEVRERAADVNEVLSGYRSGSDELAGPGEPRREYAPGVPLMRRYAAKAAERAG